MGLHAPVDLGPMRDAHNRDVFPLDAVDHSVVPAPYPPAAFVTCQLSDHVLPCTGVLAGIRFILQPFDGGVEVAAHG